VFRHAPTELPPKYSPYVSPTTAAVVAAETIPALHATLQELLTLGNFIQLDQLGADDTHWVTDRSGRAMGFPESDLPSSVVEDTINNTCRLHSIAESTHRPSMLLDSELGRPIEVEVILGEVIRLARRHNVKMPVSCVFYFLLACLNIWQRIETLYALLVVVQNQILRKMEERSHRHHHDHSR
jgi:2-dehydropantoate 2-reductase